MLAPRDAWNPVDPRTLSWVGGGFNGAVPLAAVLPGLVLGGAMLAGVHRGQRFGGPATPWRVAAWTAPMLAGPLIAYTAVVLGGDLVRTDGPDAHASEPGIAGRSDGVRPGGRRGGLGRGLGPLPAGRSRTGKTPRRARGCPASPAPSVARFELSSSSHATPWFRLPPDGRIGLFVAGTGVDSGELELEWGRTRDGRVMHVGAGAVGGINTRIATAPWTFVAASELPAPKQEADLVRIARRRRWSRAAPSG